jgi:hypothetical protein
MRSFSALGFGLWSLAQNFRRRKQENMYTTLLKNENEHMGSRRNLFMYTPRTTYFYKVLGERKIPP